MFLLTNECTNVAGVYKITRKRACGDIGYSREEIDTIIEKFTSAGKVFYIDDYIIIPKWPKHQSHLKPGANLYLGFLSIVQNLPDNIKEFITDRSHYDYDMSQVAGYEKYYDFGRCPPETPTTSRRCPPETGTTSPFSGDNFNLNLNSNLNSNFNNISGGKLNLSSREETALCGKLGEKPPPLIDNIKTKAQSVGMFLDDSVIHRIIKALPHPAWFSGEHSVIDFVMGKIKDAYKNKNKSEEDYRRLFISALCEWKNIPEEYPHWLRKQIKAEDDKKAQEKRSTPPANCPKCGEGMNGNTICRKCNGWVVFDEKTKEWQYQENPDFDIKAAFEKRKKKIEPGGVDF
jgi:hypothetical protein